MIARINPFRSERIDRIPYQLKGISWNALWDRLEALHFRAAIIGMDGSGKTTLLEDLGQKLSLRGFQIHRIFLTLETKRDFTRLHFNTQDLTGKIVLFDGADLMENQDWLHLCKKAQDATGLIITSHQEGLLPVLIKCETSLHLLEEIVQGLTDHPDDFPLEGLFRQHGGNLRDVFRTLYDLCAGQ